MHIFYCMYACCNMLPNTSLLHSAILHCTVLYAIYYVTQSIYSVYSLLCNTNTSNTLLNTESIYVIHVTVMLPFSLYTPLIYSTLHILYTIVYCTILYTMLYCTTLYLT